jgi:hypothetical protein
MLRFLRVSWHHIASNLQKEFRQESRLWTNQLLD